jgi:periplasmic divalent cation tolerance protein
MSSPVCRIEKIYEIGYNFKINLPYQKGVVMEEALHITTTADKKEVAERIGKSLVEKRLASCAQIMGPIKSIYWWKGKVEEAEEWLCVIKSRGSLYEEVEREIRRLHTYELPEIVAIRIDGALPAYMQWILDETASPGPLRSE